MAKYSIGIPAYNRAWALPRAVESLLKQSFRDFDIWILDDGSVDNTRDVVGELMRNDKEIKINYWRLDKNAERCNAQNLLVGLSQTEWVTFLDSDDTFRQDYLEVVEEATKKYPEANIFNYGAVVNWPDGHITYRKTFKPLVVGTGHEEFKAGQIGKGSFIFKKETWKSDFGGFPENAKTFDEFSRETERLGLQPFYKDSAPMGNPWGDDWFLFYCLTRKNISVPIDQDLYIQYVRTDNPHDYK